MHKQQVELKLPISMIDNPVKEIMFSSYGIIT
jgi:hypothetical protein